MDKMSRKIFYEGHHLNIEVNHSNMMQNVLVLYHFLVQNVYWYLKFLVQPFSDKRIKLMNEMITGMKVLKLYAWEIGLSCH